MKEVKQLQKQIEEKPFLIKHYIQTGSKDELQLDLISKAIINVYSTQRPTCDKNSLDQCHQMALSASKNLVEKLYFKILPQLIDASKQNSLLYGYLKAWTVMYPGKWRYSQYPNFESKYGKLVSKVQMPVYLKQTLSQFQSNIKTSNDVVEFFEDSLSSEYETERQKMNLPTERINPQELEVIKKNLEFNNNNVIKWIDDLYELRHKYLSAKNLDPESQRYVGDNLRWMNMYISKFEQVRNKPNWIPTLSNYYKQLQAGNQTNHNNSNWHSDTMKINSERKINLPRQQQLFSHFRTKINTKSPGKESRFSNIQIDKQQSINALFGNQMKATGKQQPLLIKKHVPNFELSPERKSRRSRNKIFGQSSNSFMFDTERKNFSRVKEGEKSMMKTIKLSEFSSQKEIRKRTVNYEELDNAPEWMLAPYLSFFDSYQLFSRYRKNCLLKYSTIFEDQRMIVHCIKKRVSSTALELVISYQNFSSIPINIGVCYKIAHQAFSVKSNKKIQKNLMLHKNQTHQFTLAIKQLPLKICALELSYDNNIIQIPLPFTIANYIRSQPISKQQFLSEWNSSNNHTNYSLSTKICYNQKVLDSQQIHEQFENCVDLGRTEKYSFEQFGLKLYFEYYELQFLLIFAFNIDTFLTLEMVSCKYVDQERIEVLNYYMKTLIMLLENRS